MIIGIFIVVNGIASATMPARPDDVLWSTTVGENGICYSIARTPDGGYVIGGMSDTVSPLDAYAAKVDQNGSLIWQNNFPNGVVFNAVVNTLDGNYLFAGSGHGATNDSLEGYLVKTRPDGSTLFAKIYGITDGKCEFVDMVQESDGSIAILGNTDNLTMNGRTVSGGIFVNVWKTDADGNLLWSKAYRTGGWKSYGIVRAPDGGYAIAGAIRSNDSLTVDAYLLRIDGDGNKLWDTTYPGTNDSIFFTICNAGDDGYALAGKVDSANETNFFIQRVTLNGTGLWNRTLDVCRAPSDAIPASDGGFVFACGHDILKVDKDGIIDWVRDFGTDNESLYCVAEATDGSYVFGGYTRTVDLNLTVLLVNIGHTQGPGYSPVCWCLPMLVLPALAIGIAARARLRR